MKFLFHQCFRSYFMAYVFIAFALCVDARGEDKGEMSFFPYPRDGVILGQGWNSVLGRPTTDVCIDFQEFEVPAHETRTNFSEIQNRHHLDRLLKVDATASYKGLSFSADFSGSVSLQKTVNQNSHSILASVSILSGSRFVGPIYSADKFSPVQLSRVAADLLKADQTGAITGAEDFWKRCGDSYVSYVEKGGELDAIFQFGEDNRTQADSFALKIKAGGLVADGSLGANFAINSDDTNKMSNIHVVQLGGPRIPTPVDVSRFAETVRAFSAPPASSEFEEKAFRIAVVPYTKLHNGGGTPQQATFQNLYLLHSLFSELRDSYQQILLDYKSPKEKLLFKDDANDAAKRFVVLNSFDHKRVIGEATDQWVEGKFSVDRINPPTKKAIELELSVFSAVDKVSCGNVNIDKYATDKVANYLTYAFGKKLSSEKLEYKRLKLTEAYRQSIKDSPEKELLTQIFDEGLNGIPISDSASSVPAKIDYCLSAVDQHPWSYNSIRANYLKIGQHLLEIERVIDLCLTNIEGRRLERANCDDDTAIETMNTLALEGLNKLIKNKTSFWVDRVSKKGNTQSWEEAFEEFLQPGSLPVLSSNLLSATSEDGLKLDEAYRNGFAAEAVSDGETALSSIDSLSRSIALESVASICRDSPLSICAGFVDGQDSVSQPEGVPVFGVQLVRPAKSDPLTEGTVPSSERAWSLKAYDATASSPSDRAASAMRTINFFASEYFRLLKYLPIPRSEFRSLQISTLSAPELEDAQDDLNRFVFRSRLEKAIDYFCSIEPRVRFCNNPLEVSTLDQVPNPPFEFNDRRQHVGCIATAERQVLERRRKAWEFWRKDEYRTETYCAAEGAIVDAYEALALGGQFLR